MKNKKKLIIWGATGQSIVLKELLNREYDLVALFDNDKKVTSPFDNIPIFYKTNGFLKWFKEQKETFYFICAIGGDNGRARVKISQFLKKYGLKEISAIHKKSLLADDIKMGNSVQIMLGACIATRCKIDSYVVINTSASIDHECVIKKGCHIGPGAKLAGKIIVDEYTFIGIGAVILPNIHIGKGCIVGAGSIVTKNIPDYHIVYGNPAKLVRKMNDGNRKI